MVKHGSTGGGGLIGQSQKKCHQRRCTCTASCWPHFYGGFPSKKDDSPLNPNNTHIDKQGFLNMGSTPRLEPWLRAPKSKVPFDGAWRNVLSVGHSSLSPTVGGRNPFRRSETQRNDSIPLKIPADLGWQDFVHPHYERWKAAPLPTRRLTSARPLWSLSSEGLAL